MTVSHASSFEEKSRMKSFCRIACSFSPKFLSFTSPSM
jgi:hypothetical protein